MRPLPNMSVFGLMLFVALILIAAPAAAQTPAAQSLPPQSLAERLERAAPYDTLRIPAGTWTEGTLHVRKPVVIAGEPGARLVGDGSYELIVILSDDVTIQGLDLSGVGRTFMEDRAAIRVQDASRCRIADNNFSDVFFGVYLARAADCTVTGNTLRANFERETTGGNAIHSWYSNRLYILDNDIAGFRDGIYLEFTNDSEVAGNRSDRNLRYGLHFMFSDRCSYDRNSFSDNRAGVAVMYADGLSMRDNTFQRAWGSSAYGLLLKEIRRGEILGNRFEGNSVGILMESTDAMDFHGNRFLENGWAIKMMASSIGNTFTDNIFAGNTFDIATNSRSSTSRFEANFWDRYTGYDLDRDGFGDVPFRPVSLFSVLAERHEAMLYLYRSVLVDLLNTAESLLPVLTPVDLADPSPRMVHPAAATQSGFAR
jgi:nitrous oxidase accessory protein